VFDRLCFFVAAADVGGERELLAELAHLVVVVAAIQAESLRSFACWLRPLDRDRLDRGAAELEVV
jgi:hypothetical protein